VRLVLTRGGIASVHSPNKNPHTIAGGSLVDVLNQEVFRATADAPAVNVREFLHLNPVDTEAIVVGRLIDAGFMAVYLNEWWHVVGDFVDGNNFQDIKNWAKVFPPDPTGPRKIRRAFLFLPPGERDLVKDGFRLKDHGLQDDPVILLDSPTLGAYGSGERVPGTSLYIGDKLMRDNTTLLELMCQTLGNTTVDRFCGIDDVSDLLKLQMGQVPRPLAPTPTRPPENEEIPFSDEP
jgi:hypothetical protein